MSRTNLQVMQDALRLVGVIHQIQTPSNEDAQDALRRLNDMMLNWKRVHGIDLGFWPQTSTTADIPIDDEYFEVVTLQLAKNLALHWGVSLTPEASARAAELWTGLMSQFSAPSGARLSHVPGTRRNSYNIDSDTI